MTKPQALLWFACAAVAFGLGVDVGGAVNAPATVDVRQAPITTTVVARIATVHVTDGDTVAKDAVLITLDSHEVDQELALAEAELIRVKDAVRARQVDIKDQDFEVGLRLQQDADKASQSAQTLSSTIKQTETELVSVDALVEKNEALVKAQLASAQLLDELRVRQPGLRERLTALGDELRQMTGLRDAASKRVAEWRVRTGQRDALAAPDVAAVALQEERVKQAQTKRERLTLRAPLAGQVSSVMCGVGDVVRDGVPLLIITDARAQHATAWVDEAHAFGIAVGDSASLRTTDGRAIVRSGRVRALGGAILAMPERLWQVPGEPMFGRAVYIDLDDDTTSDALLPGQTLDASFSR